MLLCEDTVTIIRCDGMTYTAAELRGVSWFDKTQVKLEDSGLAFANAVKVRIPAQALSPDGLFPQVGDSIVRGSLPAGTVVEKPADLAALHPRKIMTVGDNRRGGLPHVVVIGQ
jgi:hypothetical protein